jgi:hypothetical protein
MEKVAFYISIIAIIISVGVPIFEFLYNKKINKINLISEYFKEIYGEFLIKRVPLARQYIHFNGRELSGTDKLLDVFREMRESSLYFKYNDKEFYGNLKGKIQAIEDCLVTKTGIMNSDEYAEFYNTFEKELGMIYECISDGYLGKRIKKIK